MVREEKPELEEAKAEEDEEGMGEELNFPERENDPSTGPLDLLEEAAIFFLVAVERKKGKPLFSDTAFGYLVWQTQLNTSPVFIGLR